MLPLFPPEGTHITIRQGQAGSCYYLAFVLALCSNGYHGRALISSMFRQTDEGVFVFFPGGAQSFPHLLHVKRASIKYAYSYDNVAHKHVFFICNAQLLEMEKAEFGVKSNALAIIILEHLIPYFFTNKWSTLRRSTSLSAHSFVDRFAGKKDPDFLADLFRVNTRKWEDVSAVIALKASNPSYPMSVIMAAPSPGPRTRHCWYVHAVEGDVFKLINPHDSTRVETHPLAEMQAKGCEFWSYHTAYPKTRVPKLLPPPEKAARHPSARGYVERGLTIVAPVRPPRSRAIHDQIPPPDRALRALPTTAYRVLPPSQRSLSKRRADDRREWAEETPLEYINFDRHIKAIAIDILDLRFNIAQNATGIHTAEILFSRLDSRSTDFHRKSRPYKQTDILTFMLQCIKDIERAYADVSACGVKYGKTLRDAWNALLRLNNICSPAAATHRLRLFQTATPPYAEDMTPYRTYSPLF